MSLKLSDNLKIKIFADGANKETMLEMYQKEYIKGLTTNPTLMRKSGIKDYKSFCLDILKSIKDKSLSFEVFSDDIIEMERQADEISSWGNNIFVKIPVTNTKKVGCYNLIKKLSKKKIKVNVTAVMTIDQVKKIVDSLNSETQSYISIFAGRIADTGRDPVPIMIEALKIMKKKPLTELIWASPRELLNIFQANDIGCHIITATEDILNKLKLIDYDLNQYSLDTVKMFYEDALSAGFKIK